MTSVACVITGYQDTPVAALSVITRSEQAEPALLKPAVIAVARAISRAVSAGTRAGTDLPERSGT
jgi:DNA-binding IclR family transcriptional regulator